MSEGPEAGVTSSTLPYHCVLVRLALSGVACIADTLAVYVVHHDPLLRFVSFGVSVCDLGKDELRMVRRSVIDVPHDASCIRGPRRVCD